VQGLLLHRGPQRIKREPQSDISLNGKLESVISDSKLVIESLTSYHSASEIPIKPAHPKPNLLAVNRLLKALNALICLSGLQEFRIGHDELFLKID
jgi:hypothetical protein